MNDSNKAVLIFGATRGTGLESARMLRQNGVAVTAVVRPSSDTAELGNIGATTVIADIFDPDNVTAIFKSGSYQAVILSLSAQKGDAQRADREGAKVIIAAAGQHGVTRILMVTAIGCGDSRPAVAPKVIEFLGEVLAAKTETEDYLMGAGLDATILRPGGLTDDPASGTAIRSEDHSLMGVAHRADVGRLVVECIDDPTTIGKIYHTIDPEIKWQAPLQRGEDIKSGKD